MHGAEDHWTNSERSQQLAKRASSDDKTLKLYDGSYHELLTDINNAEVWADVIGWIDARI